MYMRAQLVHNTNVSEKVPYGEMEAPDGSTWKSRLDLAYTRWQAARPTPATQEEFGRAVLGDHGNPITRQSTVSNWFRGVIPGDFIRLITLAGVLGVDAGWLLFGGWSNASMTPSVIHDLPEHILSQFPLSQQQLLADISEHPSFEQHP
jgi:transcriptional regulator with XRE-family HTH domain